MFLMCASCMFPDVNWVLVMTRYIENIDTSFSIYRYIVLYCRKNIDCFDSSRYSQVYRRDIFDIFATHATDSLLRCVTGKKDYKCGELTVS